MSGPEGPPLAGQADSPVERERRPEDVAWIGEGRPELGPRIYVASLTDYNHGVLHGAWVSASDDVEGMREAIQQMLVASPTARRYGEPAEEWRIDDFDGWGRYLHVEEYASLEMVVRLAEGLDAHGEAFGAWAELCAGDEEELARFEDAFLGEFASLEGYGESVCADLGVDLDELGSDLPEILRPYLHLDVAGWARDLELGGGISSVESAGVVYVFAE